MKTITITIKLVAAIAMLFFSLINSSCKKELVPETEKETAEEAFDDKHSIIKSHGYVSDDMVLLWNENVSKILSRTGSPLPALSRHFTMAQIAVHDVLNSIKPKYETYAFKNYREKNADADAAVASAAYWTMKMLSNYLVSINRPALPLQTSGNDWEGWYATSLSTIADGEAKEKGQELGKKAAEAIMLNRSTDNYLTASISFVPIPPQPFPMPAGRYRPTTSVFPPVPPNTSGFANWGIQMKPFGMTSNDQFRPGEPPALTSDQYAKDFNEVKSLGARVNSTRTADQSIIANFWWETAVNIWNRVARKAAANKKMDAWKTARLLAMVNVSVFDAFLSSFDGLYHFYKWRPETAIRLAAADGNPQTAPVAGWLPFGTDIKSGIPPNVIPLAPTPPVPEFPNSHAVVGAAVGKVLQEFFETDNTNIDLTSNDIFSVGVVRHYDQFSDAVNENFHAMIYAGFNFRYSMNVGDQMGKRLGKYVFDTHFREADDD